MNKWRTGVCVVCKHPKRKVRSVSAVQPAFLVLCGPCAKRAEKIPFENRTFGHVKHGPLFHAFVTGKSVDEAMRRVG